MKVASITLPSISAITKSENEAKKATPAARPSRPSIRFIALTSAVTQSSVSGRLKAPIWNVVPRIEILSNEIPPNHKIRPATDCTTSLVFAPTPRRSSATPSPTMHASPAANESNLSSLLCRNEESLFGIRYMPTSGMMNAAVIARPPRRGIEPAWIFRCPSGSS